MHNDKALTSLSSWTALLSVSSHFSMARIRARAISEIITYPAPGLDPVDQVALATKHDVPEWLPPAYAALCQRENAIELEEAEKLGMKTTVLVAKAREAVRKQASGQALCFQESLVERVVDGLFWPASAPAPSHTGDLADLVGASISVVEDKNGAAAHFDPLDDPACAKLSLEERKKKGMEANEGVESQQREREQRARKLTESIYEQVRQAGENGEPCWYWNDSEVLMPRGNYPASAILYLRAKRLHNEQKAAKKAAREKFEREQRERELVDFMAEQEEQPSGSDRLMELAKFMAEREQEISGTGDDDCTDSEGGHPSEKKKKGKKSKK